MARVTPERITDRTVADREACAAAFRDAKAAFKRARAALPKRTVDVRDGTAAWYAENGMKRCDVALDALERPDPPAAE